MAFLKLCGEIQLQGKTHIGLLITAVRASLGLFSAPSYWAVHLQLSQTCFCSGGFGVLYMRACFKNIIWLKLTFFYYLLFLLFLFFYNSKPENVGKCKANTCVCVCVCMCVRVHVCACACVCVVSMWWEGHVYHFFPNSRFLASSLPGKHHGLELPSRIGTLHNHIFKLQVTEVNV